MNNFFSAEIIIRAYEQGYFPMAESKDGDIYWHAPDPRAIIPLEDPKVPKHLWKKIKRGDFDFSRNFIRFSDYHCLSIRFGAALLRAKSQQSEPGC